MQIWYSKFCLHDLSGNDIINLSGKKIIFICVFDQKVMAILVHQKLNEKDARAYTAHEYDSTQFVDVLQQTLALYP